MTVKENILQAFRGLNGTDRKEVFETISRTMGGAFNRKPESDKIQMERDDLIAYAKRNNIVYSKIMEKKLNPDKMLHEWASLNNDIPFTEVRHMYNSLRLFVSEYKQPQASHKEIQANLKGKPEDARETERKRREAEERTKRECEAILKGGEMDERKATIYYGYFTGKSIMPMDQKRFDECLSKHLKLVNNGLLKYKSELWRLSLATFQAKKELLKEFLNQ